MDRENRENVKTLNICFVGLGSIAERHIRNIKKLFSKTLCNINIDIYRSGVGSRNIDNLNNMIRKVYYEFDDVPNNYDVIFITNPTKYHYSTLKKFHLKGKHFFIEKPVFCEEDIGKDEIRYRKDSIYYVACPLRYNNVIKYIKKNVDFSKVSAMRCISSSYLPDWRQGIDYRETYSAKKELGGGVAIDLIHEWDYIKYLIGKPNKVKSIIGKFSNLEINSDDIAVYIGEYDDKVVELHLDYFGRIPIRQLQIFGDDDTIMADIINGTVHYIREDKIITLPKERDDYQIEELKYFFNAIEDGKNDMNDIKTACNTLKIAKGDN